MLTLFLLRHAKSSWSQSDLSDHDRPLNSRGRLTAPAVARQMVAQNWAPERILVSSAQRTRETISLMLPMFAHDLVLRVNHNIYHASPQTYLEAVHAHAGVCDSLMIVGHNPSVQALAVALCGTGTASGLEAMREKYPTAGLSVITFDAPDFGGVSAGTGTLHAFLRPRDLAETGSYSDMR